MLKAYGTTSCSCDWLCYVYNDCCHNFEEICTQQVEKFTRTWRTFPKGTVQFASDGNIISACRKGCTSNLDVLTEGSCLTKSYKVISECILEGRPCKNLDKHDPNLFIPMYDQKSHLTLHSFRVYQVQWGFQFTSLEVLHKMLESRCQENRLG